MRSKSFRGFTFIRNVQSQIFESQGFTRTETTDELADQTLSTYLIIMLQKKMLPLTCEKGIRISKFT